MVTPIDSVQTPTTGVKNWVKQSKPKIWKVKRSKAYRKLEKVKGQASQGPPDTKSHRYHTFNSVKLKAYLSDGQAVKALN